MSAEKYYVIDNMYQGRKFNIERFDNLNDAITSFNDVRAVRGQIGNMHRVSAIGVEKGVKAVDLLHDYDGFLIRINDTTEGINAKELADAACNKLNTKIYEYVHGEIGKTLYKGTQFTFLKAYEQNPVADSYVDNKILNPLDKHVPASAINELHIISRNYKEWVNGADIVDTESSKWCTFNELKECGDVPIVVNMVNVSYIEPCAPLAVNQADLSVDTVNLMAEDFNKEYRIEFLKGGADTPATVERTIYTTDDFLDALQKFYDFKSIMPDDSFSIMKKDARFKKYQHVFSGTKFVENNMVHLSKEEAAKEFSCELKDTPDFEVIQTKLNRGKSR